MTFALIDRPVATAETIPLFSTRTDAGLRHIALLGNFPPRRCGIATFTADVRSALAGRFPNLAVDVFAMDDGSGPYDYSDAVSTSIPEEDPAAYRAAAQRIEASGAQLLWIQHEYGIFGGPAGAHLLALLDVLTIPVAVTLHTVLARPDANQRRVMQALVRRADRLFVMAERGREILAETYGARPGQVRVIPHGVPDRPLTDSAPMKARLGFSGRKLLLTFGLLSPGKGIETMIEALPAIVTRHPDVLYVVLGASHPHLVARQGEAYRERLAELAGARGVADHVRFVDEFVETERLLDFLEAADIYVTPYLGAQQMTSGTLAYAVGMGKPVVSTPYVHAAELLARGHGRLVGFGDSAGFSAAINALLDNGDERERMARANHALGRAMLWPRLAEAAVAEMTTIFEAGPRPAAEPVPPAMPALASFSAIARLSDDTGILQHSDYGVPNRAHGYCVDDNARALILMQRADDLTDSLYARWTPVYAAFVQHAWNPDAGRFRNFMAFDRHWLEEAGSDDSSARTLWSLGVTARDGRLADLRDWARGLFECSAPHFLDFTFPRSRAFAVLGAAEMMEAQPGHEFATLLLATFGKALAEALQAERRPDWIWFEPSLSYDNARLPEALIRAGVVLGRPEWVADGLEALAWLVDVQRAPLGHFRPVGTASFGMPYAPPAPFDQQPLEAWATIDACAAAHAASGDRVWVDAALAAWRWYEGENDLGATMGDPASGECLDGLGPVEANRNRGAESVLAFQLANRAIRALLDR
ncbi:glycosyltransferase family 4 protein [Sphingosinicella sp.]|uniref:glycosyltransferase family 4 protein n=1 Tax=Sphingosinicella sp. TaxID=1917971 RepID=UPI0040380939